MKWWTYTPVLALGTLLALTPSAGAVAGQWTLDNAVFTISPPAGANGLSALEITTTDAVPYGLASLELPAGLQIEDLTTLSFRTYSDDDTCGGGSPRLQLRIDADGDGAPDGNVFVYGGAHPFGAGCAPTGAWNDDDLLDGALRFDSTQLGGPFYGDQASAQAAAGAGHGVLRATFVWDSSWLFGHRTLFVDDITVNCFVLGEPGDVAASLVSGVTGC